MPKFSKIEWTDFTWNPTTGCTKISEGCQNCYAERMAKRLKAIGLPRYANGFELALHPDLLEVPTLLRKPRRIFVNSMSDLFHEDVPLEFIKSVFAVMEQCPQHVFQVLTKRSQRLATVSTVLRWPANVWAGVTVENKHVQHRIADLSHVPAPIRFLSLEPLLGPLDNLNLTSISWVIVGGESGPKARPMCKEWVSPIHRQCKEEGVPFFFKQWGGVNKKAAGRSLDGRFYDEMPVLSSLVV